MPIDFPNSPTTNQEYTSGQTTWVYDGARWNVKAATAYSNDSAPVGTIVNFAGSVAGIPAGWIACDGSAVSRTTYATLFSVIGTTYGAGDSSTTFNLPDIDTSSGVFIIRWTATLGVTATDSLYTAPVGSMLSWPTTSSYPTGWLRADGSAVSRTSYADLFALIGTTYGTGNGSTTFNLPNLVETGGPVTIIKATMSGGQQPSTIAHASAHARGGTDVLDGDRVQVDYVPTNYTRNSAVSEAGSTTDLAAHLAGVSDKLAFAWSNWSPTITGSGGLTFTAGNGSYSARYCQIGKSVMFRAYFQFGSTSSISGAGAFNLPLPVTSASSWNPGINVYYLDSGSAHYPGIVNVVDGSTTSIVAATLNASGTWLIQSSVTSGQPFTWAANDIIYWAGAYEAA